MNRQEESLSPNNELVQEQADKILEIFKSIKKSLSCKYEKIAKEYGFTAPQLGVIFHLYMMPSITLNELSDHMSLTKSTVSGIVDRLAKQGVVNREIPKDNRRIVKLSISEEFKKNNDIFAIKKRFFDEFLLNSIKEMESEEVEKIIYGLRQLSVLLKDDN
jgi:DNA-binding MarR family transcriptional regulator